MMKHFGLKVILKLYVNNRCFAYSIRPCHFLYAKESSQLRGHLLQAEEC